MRHGSPCYFTKLRKRDITSMAYTLTKAERETILSRADDEMFWTVMTSSPAKIRNFSWVAERIGVPIVQWDNYTIRVQLPLEAVRIVVPRVLTDAERTQRRQALLQARAAQRAEEVMD
jgi:hypothetical protein